MVRQDPRRSGAGRGGLTTRQRYGTAPRRVKRDAAERLWVASRALYGAFPPDLPPTGSQRCVAGTRRGGRGCAETRAHGPWVTDAQPVDSHVDSGTRGQTADVSTGRSERVPEETVDLDVLWSHAIDGLADSTVTPQQRAWLRTTRPLGLLDGTALLAAPNEFTKDVLETRLRLMITTAL